jgi:ribosomal protein S18 acetylase RimI-like enzyme
VSRAVTPVTIRAYRSEDSIAEITRLLHEAYADLARQGFKYLASHQDEAMTARRLSRGRAFIAEQGGRMVGIISLYPHHPESLVVWYRRPGVFYFGQFGVRPDLQRRGVGLQLLRHVETMVRAEGADEIACDTAEGAAHLRDWYERQGYRFVEFVDWPVTNYRSVVLSKALSRAGSESNV